MGSGEVALRVNEIFGPTIQGEGPSAGKPAVFLRLAGCNLDCAWCDTPYSWDWKRHDRKQEEKHLSVGQVAEQLGKLLGAHTVPEPAPLLVVSGGEPLIQADALQSLLMGLLAYPWGRLRLRPTGPVLRWASRLGALTTCRPN